MAKLAVLFTVIFLLFTFSQARFFTTEPDESVTGLPEPNSESTTAILLPSERRDFKPPKLLDFKHDDDAAASVTEADSSVVSVPLKKISFHPVNRHFPRRPVVFPFRHHNHRNCLFNKYFRHLNPRFKQKRFISYGNDMIVWDERSFDPESRGVIRRIEARWGNFYDDAAESNHRVDFMKHHHHDHDLHHDREHEHEDNHKHHHEHHHHHGREKARDETVQHDDGGLMEKFRRLFFHV